jgi:hypothetical protein
MWTLAGATAVAMVLCDVQDHVFVGVQSQNSTILKLALCGHGWVLVHGIRMQYGHEAAHAIVANQRTSACLHTFV